MNPFEREVASIAHRHGVEPAKAMLKHKNLTAPIKQEAMWNLNLRGRSLPRIGSWAGLDHTTVLYGVRRHQARYEADHARRWRA